MKQSCQFSGFAQLPDFDVVRREPGPRFDG